MCKTRPPHFPTSPRPSSCPPPPSCRQAQRHADELMRVHREGAEEVEGLRAMMEHQVGGGGVGWEGGEEGGWRVFGA